MTEYLSASEIKDLLEKRNAEIVHEDWTGLIAVTRESDGSRRNLSIMKWLGRGKYSVLWDRAYNWIGRFFLKFGLYYIGVKGEE